MPENIREVMKRHHAFYEVMPYYIILEERTHGAAAAMRRVQAGFDIDVYGVKTSHDPGPSLDYELVYEALKKMAETTSTTDFCIIEVIPFGSTVFLDTKRHFEPDAMLRIRIMHGRGLGQPAGAPEEHALKAIEEQLHELGVSAGRGRF